MKSLRSSTSNSKPVWALVDEGKHELETQCLSLVEAMELPAHLYRVSLSAFWQLIPTLLIPDLISKVKVTPKPLNSPWPALIICGGTKALKVGSYIKNVHGGFLVSLGSTLSFSSDKMILVGNSTEQVKKKIITLGPLHRIQQDNLLNARQHIYRKLEHLPKPRVGIFLNGQEPLKPLFEILLSLCKKSPFSLMIHTEASSTETFREIETTLAEIPHVCWDGQGENPYLGFLSHSDAVILSNTSSLKIAEATSTGKPIFMYCTVSKDSFSNVLLEKGYIFELKKDVNLFPRVFLPPLHESQRVAGIIQEAYLKSISS